MNKNKIITLLSYIFSSLFLIVGYACDIWYLVRYGRSLLDSDMASEMILSDLLNKSSSIISSGWIYSTELHIFETQWFYRLGLLISPDNWHIARVIAMSLMLALLAFVMFWLGKSAGLNQYSIWLAGVTMWPVGAWYCFYNTFAGHYLPYTLFSVFSLLCILKIYQKPATRFKIGLYVFLGFLAFASGLNGVRQLMVFFAPLFVATVILIIVYKINIVIPMIYSVILNLSGYALNMFVLSHKYRFVTHDYYVWGNGTRNWLLTARSFFESFGYCQICEIEGLEIDFGIPLFSLKGISIGCGLLIGILVFFSLIYLVFKINKLSDLDKIIVTVICSMLFVMGLIFTYIQFDQRFWQQTIVFGFVILLLFIKNFDYQQLAVIGNKITKEMAVLSLTGVMAVFIILSSLGTMKNFIDYPLHAQPGLSNVVNWIVENTDYEYGIADFWQSNIVTELTNGDIEMYSVIKLENEVELHRWLQKTEHEQSFPPQRYFLIVAHDQALDAYDYLIPDFDNDRIYEDANFIVFGVN